MTNSQLLETKARRSQRVVARIRVTVTRRGSDVPALSEDTDTLVVNANGGLVLLMMKVQLGEILMLRNLISQAEQLVRVVSVGEKQESKNEVAIAFVASAPHFWHIAFPPADWNLAEP